MSVEDERQDDFVPLKVVQNFARNFIQGFSRLMKEIGFKHSSNTSKEAQQKGSSIESDSSEYIENTPKIIIT